MKTKGMPMDLSDPPRSRVTGHKSRHVLQLSNVPFFGRTTWMSRIQQVAAQAAPDVEFPRLLAFVEVWKWIVPYLRDFVHKNAMYRTYAHGKSGIFGVEMLSDSPLRIAVAADWGTGTLEAEIVAVNMMKCAPQLTLHLGDVYYMGEIAEINENCLGESTKTYQGVKWPKGVLGSFALMGNHEMYSGGQGYFGDFLPGLGMFNADGSINDEQAASYFCIDTPHWVILGLDTGYHSGGFPAFASVPGLRSIPALNVDARFDDKMLAWLRQTMEILSSRGSSDKPILVLTHHQPVSSFERSFGKPAEQLAQLECLTGRELVWLFGHEHRLTIYEKQTIGANLTVYPRCIGHAGMPVKVTKLHRPHPEILYYDPRQHSIDNQDPNTKVGYNGHVALLFDGIKMTIEYRDILENALLLSETYAPISSGGLQCCSFLPFGSGLVPGYMAGQFP